MDGQNFDALTRAAAAATSRRGTFGMIAGTALAAALAKIELTDAKKKRKGKNKKKKCRKLNQGCGGKKKCCKGLSCTDGTCLKPVPEPECENNADCNSGEICQNGICVPEPPECENDSDCGNDELCQKGECIPEPPECVNDNDCGDNEQCQSGGCICPSALQDRCVIRCLGQEQCPLNCQCSATFPGEGLPRVVCVEDVFGFCDSADPCDSSDDCAADEICIFTTCDSPAGSGRCLPVCVG